MTFALGVGFAVVNRRVVRFRLAQVGTARPRRPTIGRCHDAVVRGVVAAIGWAVVGGVVFGWGTEYGPVLSDPPAERSPGQAVGKAVIFGLILLVLFLVETERRRRRVARDVAEG